MYVSSVTNSFVRRRRPDRWLVCLDLQRDFVIPGRPHFAEASAGVASACVRVLGHARAAGWRVVHSQLRQADAGVFGRGLFDAPIEGLRPRTTEPVFFRRSLSAFADAEFSEELRGALGAEVILIGFSLCDTYLATALAAVDLGLDLTLVEDAVGAGGAGAKVASESARGLLRPFMRTILSSDLGNDPASMNAELAL